MHSAILFLQESISGSVGVVSQGYDKYSLGINIWECGGCESGLR
jgi:hypothetical protein